ncbi:MAG: thioredoxin family protein [Prevotella sp.]|nr:thioredoxin family protein [Prevotella sp.]MDY4037849.1 thioredoxin family protein [Prevotella sp.]
MIRKKRLFFTLIAISIVTTLTAQTNFRPISYKEALAAAKAENKQVFIDFYTDWCGPCKMMASQVFPQKNVGDYMNPRFVCLKVNAEKGEGIALAKRYRIQAYPTFIVINADEVEQGRTEGARMGDAFTSELERMVNPEMTPEKLKARYEQGDRSTVTVRAYANYLVDRLNQERNTPEEYGPKMDKIDQIVLEYYDGLTSAQKLDKENMFVYRTFTRSTEASSARFMIANRAKFPPTERKEIDSLITNLYEQEMYNYLAGYKDYDANRFNAFKKELQSLGLNKQGQYDVPVQLEEAALNNVDLFIEIFDRNFMKMSESMQAGAMDGMGRRFAKADKATKLKLSKAIRRQMLVMNYQMLYTAFSNVYSLEAPQH